MVNILKLAVGIRDVAHLRAVQRERAEVDPPLRHRTRLAPRRAAEILDGGSIFWVVAGVVSCRQRVVGIKPDRRPDGAACAALLLDPVITSVAGRPVKPFQGWRYLNRNEAPPDVGDGQGAEPDLPPALRHALLELCLL